MSADSLTIERQAAPRLRPSEPAGGAIKSILFAVHDDQRLEGRFQAALSLARACSAHLELLHVIPVEAYTAIDSFGGAFVSGEIVGVLEQNAEELRHRLESHLKIEDVSWNYEVVTSAVLPALIRQSAFADLTVMGREPPWHEFSRTGPNLLGAFITSARSPLCVPGDGRETFDPFGKALIAWNGSIQSANAVRSTIGLLKMASEVRVIRLVEDEEPSLADERLLEYLSRHDVHAELESHLPRADLAQDFIDRATGWNAEYVLMGGYSHSRAGEFLFGGLTRSLLSECPLSLVMAH